MGLGKRLPGKWPIRDQRQSGSGRNFSELGKSVGEWNSSSRAAIGWDTLVLGLAHRGWTGQKCFPGADADFARHELGGRVFRLFHGAGYQIRRHALEFRE